MEIGQQLILNFVKVSNMNDKIIKHFISEEERKHTYQEQSQKLKKEMNDEYPNLKEYPFISCLKIEDYESEEFVSFFYVNKSESITENTFIKTIQNILTGLLVERPDFEYREAYLDENLLLFFKELGLCESDILIIKECHIDWNLREFFIDSKKYYIYAEWEILA